MSLPFSLEPAPTIQWSSGPLSYVDPGLSVPGTRIGGLRPTVSAMDLSPDLIPNLVPPEKAGSPGWIVPHQERLAHSSDASFFQPFLQQ